MKSYQLSRIGVIFFFLGVSFLFLSWYFTYPIHMTPYNEIIFSQFSLLIWPGLLFSLTGLFLTGYYVKRNSVKAICASLFPLIIYSYSFFFSSLPTSDTSNVKSMFEIFHLVGINSSVVPYFQYPTYFTLNEIMSQISGIDGNCIPILFYALYGILLGLYLYMFLFKETKNNLNQVAILGVFLYFTVSFSYLNYQWVPQTLALVFCFLLFITFTRHELEYKLINFIIFTALVFTHAFLPLIFLLVYGLYSFKKKEHIKMFILMSCLYFTVLIFYTTYYFPQIIAAFTEALYGFGEYTNTISRSLKETTGFVDQFISLVNRIRIPLTLLVISIGFLIGLIKKKISYTLIVLGIASGFYLSIGMVFSVLGLRALQFLIVALVVGIGFFIIKWKKITVTFVFILILLSVFGPLRATYDQYLFQTNEETHACDFMAATMTLQQPKTIAIGGIDYGYFKNKENYVKYLNDNYIIARSLRPIHEEFSIFLNNFSKEKEQILLLYNQNLAKELISYGVSQQEIQNLEKQIILNNKIFVCGNTYILSGLNRIPGKWIDINSIQADSIESPIGKYFTTQKILWTFDDYSIASNYHPPNKGFGGLSERINSYGGNVNIMTYFTSETYTNRFNNEIRNYSVVNDFGWSRENINASLEFFSRKGVTPASHGWNHSEDLDHANISFAYKIINYTLWNWKNNYNITPHFFLGPGTTGNYNVTLALKRFSDTYWTVYGENFGAYSTQLFPNGSKPAVDYIGNASYVAMFDPLFGANWGIPCKTLKEAQDFYNTSSKGKEVLFIRGHPALLNRTDQSANLTLWQQWIDWIYQTHQLININHTEAIYYNIDRHNFVVEKNSDTNYTIDLTHCKFSHNILFSSPYQNDLREWRLYNENERYIGKIKGDTFLTVEPGLKYYFILP